MNLNDLKVFISVVETGSFASASKVLNMPSTTVSRKVQSLEDSLGVKLLHRSTRKLSFTAEGRDYFQRCQQHLIAIEEANDLMMQSQTNPKGTIRITSALDFAIRYVHPWIEAFQNHYPQINIELDTSDTYADLVSDRVDIAFRSGILKDSSLIARRIGPKHSICCASPKFLKGLTTSIDHPNDLVGHDCIVMGKSLHHKAWRFIEKKTNIDIQVTGRFATNSMHLAVQSTLAGKGFAYLPIALVKSHLDSGKLIRVLERFQTPASSMFLVYQSQKYMAAPKRLFIDFVIAKTHPKAPWQLD